ncbi:muconolactone Delta-isomerase [Ornithinimicrobium pekingense]|uniref:Muconolactone Delta-isomerase n=2 Tax=Ornithinimicrobium pekingense TaxID=384677 RepID=A0ABQ2F7X7_9MICO|nr:muconolactone Delta-isomerase family protein [Ornithinimicrobium pekingense]GGK69652.1 muconolactone Delta-isomerase [Ornithinimicrobium pekingense]
MQYMVRMTVTLPPDLDPEVREQLVAAEKAYSQRLQQEGRIAAIWRVAGQFANYCLFDVASHDELHELVSGLPMFGYIQAEVEALATHPNSIR